MVFQRVDKTNVSNERRQKGEREIERKIGEAG